MRLYSKQNLNLNYVADHITRYNMYFLAVVMTFNVSNCTAILYILTLVAIISLSTLMVTIIIYKEDLWLSMNNTPLFLGTLWPLSRPSTVWIPPLQWRYIKETSSTKIMNERKIHFILLYFTKHNQVDKNLFLSRANIPWHKKNSRIQGSGFICSYILNPESSNYYSLSWRD